MTPTWIYIAIAAASVALTVGTYALLAYLERRKTAQQLARRYQHHNPN